MDCTASRRRPAGKGRENRVKTPEKLQLILEALDELKAQDINVIEVTEQTVLTDYLVICSGTSATHLRALMDRVKERLGECGCKGVRFEGYQAARWILLDYGDVVVHAFDPAEREFYDLEAIWQKSQSAVA